MIAFLQRLVGSHAEQRQEDARFRKNLNGMAARNTELEQLRNRLREIATDARDVGVVARTSLPSNVSGEHQLHLTGVTVHGGKG